MFGPTGGSARGKKSSMRAPCGRFPPAAVAAEREAVVHAHPRTAHFKEDIIQAFYDGIKHKPETTFLWMLLDPILPERAPI
jgi:hypothetical protein